MIVPDLFFSLIIAFLISLIASVIMTKRTPRQGFWLFFLVIFLGTWAGGGWARELAVSWRLREWLPFLFAAVIAALFFYWLAPGEPRVERQAVLEREKTLEILEEVEQQRKVKKIAYISINIFFWVILSLLLVAIILRYL